MSHESRQPAARRGAWLDPLRSAPPVTMAPARSLSALAVLAGVAGVNAGLCAYPGASAVETGRSPRRRPAPL